MTVFVKLVCTFFGFPPYRTNSRLRALKKWQVLSNGITTFSFLNLMHLLPFNHFAIVSTRKWEKFVSVSDFACSQLAEHKSTNKIFFAILRKVNSSSKRILSENEKLRADGPITNWTYRPVADHILVNRNTIVPNECWNFRWYFSALDNQRMLGSWGWNDFW